MNIKPIFLSPSADILEPKLTKKFTSLSNLIFAAGKHSLPDSLVLQINHEIEEIGVFPGTTTETIKKLDQVQKDLLKKLEKDHQLVPKNHFRNLWMIVGMSAFGLPLGAAFGLMVDNMALLALGLPIGLAIGVALGTSLDMKAKKEGRQLDFNVT
ncbi:hypothetical protein [Algoriphagus sp.]|uniref:hypothetical protein n=1 Tax=Algoriphagus sp. TaxID=1872435 RepID=UPI002718484B|nr:hypothetical protein [Algoriphagus sp.]MDO8966381.1 hypothetical protein [Algoriphagus sp.]MDP3202328.1 hypothetical protein [Algoriphagus sp.]